MSEKLDSFQITFIKMDVKEKFFTQEQEMCSEENFDNKYVVQFEFFAKIFILVYLHIHFMREI